MCGFLMFLPPLSETSVSGVSGDGSVSAPEICNTLVLYSLCSKQTGEWTVVVAYIMLSNWASPERKQLQCNSTRALKLHFDTSTVSDMDKVETGKWRHYRGNLSLLSRQ